MDILALTELLPFASLVHGEGEAPYPGALGHTGRLPENACRDTWHGFPGAKSDKAIVRYVALTT